MTFKKLLLNLAVALSALLFGLLWVGIYQILSSKPKSSKPTTKIANSLINLKKEPIKIIPLEDLVYHEEKLEEPKLDEVNIEDEFKLTKQQKFLLNLDVQGYYESIKETSDSFDGLSMEFWLEEYNEKDEKWIPTIPQGHIEIDKKTFKFDKFHYSLGRIYFSTVKQNGVTYEFTGEYNKRKISGGEYENEVLDGELIKRKNGKVVTKNEVTFVWGAGC